MLAVPTSTPFTMPVVEPTVPAAVLSLIHVPPAVLLPNVILNDLQTVDAPVILAGVVFTVTVYVAKQVGLILYVSVTVLALSPFTTPVAIPMVANAGALELH